MLAWQRRPASLASYLNRCLIQDQLQLLKRALPLQDPLVVQERILIPRSLQAQETLLGTLVEVFRCQRFLQEQKSFRNRKPLLRLAPANRLLVDQTQSVSTHFPHRF